MSLVVDQLQLWVIGFKWAGLDPNRLRFRIPTPVRDNFSTLLEAILSDHLGCLSLASEKYAGDDPEVAKYYIRYWLEDVNAGIQGHRFDCIRAAETLAQAHHANIAGGGHRGLIEAEATRVASEAEAEAKRKAEAVKLAAAKYTLNNLLSDYCNHLEALGRRSHKDARSIFRIHVTEAWPQIAATPANQVTGEQVVSQVETGVRCRWFLPSGLRMSRSQQVLLQPDQPKLHPSEDDFVQRIAN